MKTLYVIRHAKSSWNDAEQADFDRPLNDRGERDAPRMAKRLKEKDIHPDIILSSPANRALTTAKKIAAILGFNEEKIKTERKLYHAGEDEILDVIRTVKDKYTTAFLFGHNPGLTDFVNSILNDQADIDNIPTCGIAAISFQVDDWKNISWGTGELVFFDYPKSRTDQM